MASFALSTRNITMLNFTNKMLSQVPYGNKCENSQKSILYRTINSNIISLLCDTKGVPDSSLHTSTTIVMLGENIESIVHDFLWMCRCCSSAIDIVDTFNAMHVAGILASKCFYVLSLYDPKYRIEQTTIHSIFPDEKTIHVSQKCILTLTYSELVYVLTNVQQYWNVLVKLDTTKACSLLVLCMTRFGYLCSHQLPDKILDDIQEREVMPTNTRLFVASKLCCRHFINTFVCMARDISIYHNSDLLTPKKMSPHQTLTFVVEQITIASTKLPAHIHPAIESCFAKIQQNKSCFEKNETREVLCDRIKANPLRLWDFLVQRLGECSMGQAPRKISDNLNQLLLDAIVAISPEYNNVDNNIVTDSCINILKTALEFFYIVPSADKFREINLMQEVCPGQRLNYSHDFVHFDTGQLSQVVYLHNIQFKAKPAPSTIADWDQTEVAGPISAFLQLVPDLQIWYSDSDDPIGILSDVQQITRPDAAKQPDQNPDNSMVTVAQQFNKQWSIVVNKIDAFLVDRYNNKTYRTTHTGKTHHRIFSLLVLYLRKNGLVQGICTLAINALKINN